MKEVCNINQTHIMWRKVLGLLTMALTIIASVIFITFELETIFIIPIFLGFFVAVFEILQAKLKFCVIFGMNGLDYSKGKPKKVDTKTLELYSERISRILGASFMLAIGFSAAVYLMGAFVLNLQ